MIVIKHLINRSNKTYINDNPTIETNSTSSVDTIIK